MFKRTKTLNIVDYIGIEEIKGKPFVKILIQSGMLGNQYTFISCDKIIELKNYNGEPIYYDCININNPINRSPQKDSTQLDINNNQKTPVIGGTLIGIGGALISTTLGRECRNCEPTDGSSSAILKSIEKTKEFEDETLNTQKIGFALIALGGILVAVGI